MSLKIKQTTQSIFVEEINSDKESHQEISITARDWAELSKKQLSFLQDLGQSALLQCAQKVNSEVANRYQDPARFFRLLIPVICYDEELKIRGFALLKKQQVKGKQWLYLNFLSSDPQNLCNKKLGTSFLKGIGSSLVRFIFKKCIGEKYEGIIVKPIAQAQSFFKQMGFTPIGPGSRTRVWMTSSSIA